MRGFKKLFLSMVVSSALSITVSLIYAKYYLSPKLKEIIETKSVLVLGAPVQIRDLRVVIFPKLSVAASGVKFTDPKTKLNIEVSRVYITLPLSIKLIDKKNPIGPFQILVDEPKISMTLPSSNQQKAEAGEGGPTARLQTTRDFSLNIKFQKAQLKIVDQNDQFILNPVDFDLQIPSLEKDWNLSLKSQVKILKSNFNFEIPLHLTSEFSYHDQTFATTRTTGDIGGILFNLTGQQNLTENTGTWKVGVAIDELGQLKVPPTILPAKNWKGQVKSDLHIFKTDSKTWQAYGSFNLKNISADLQYSKDDLKVSGTMKLNLDSKISYSNILKIESLKLLANLDGLEITKEKLLSKASGIHLSSEIDASGTTDEIQLHTFNLEFANLISSTSGSISFNKGPTNLKTKIQKTELTGWEKYSPLFKDHPITGALELNADLSGHIDSPENFNVALTPLKLEKIKANLAYESEDHSTLLSGPFELDANIFLKSHAKQIDDLKFLADANFSEMQIRYKDLFSKATTEKFNLKLSAEKSETGVQFNNSNLEFLHSNLNFNGKVADFERPRFVFNFNLAPLEIGDALSLLPNYKNEKYAGILRAKIQTSGIYDFKSGIQKSPISVVADADLNMPVLEHTSLPTTVTGKEAAPTTPTQPEAILPDWPVAQSAKVKINAKINKVHFNELIAEQLTSTSLLDHGILKSDIILGKIFSGNLHIKDLQSDLRKQAPEFTGRLDFNKIDSNQVLSFLSPKAKDILQAEAKGTIAFQSVLPSQVEFVKKLKASGQAELKNALISSVQIDDIINDKISKVPGVGKPKPVSTKGVAAEMSMNFNLADALLNLIDFKLRTPEKNELQAKGKLEVLTKNINLEGIAYLANAPVGGDIKAANSDNQQRFIIPFTLQGNLMQPEASFAQKSIEEILKKTMNYVAKREVEAFKKDIQDDPKKAIQNKVDQLKKGLDGLFGK